MARTLQPLVVKNIDNNFIQTVAFLGSMSKTAEVNLAGMQRWRRGSRTFSRKRGSSLPR